MIVTAAVPGTTEIFCGAANNIAVEEEFIDDDEGSLDEVELLVARLDGLLDRFEEEAGKVWLSPEPPPPHEINAVSENSKMKQCQDNEFITSYPILMMIKNGSNNVMFGTRSRPQLTCSNRLL